MRLKVNLNALKKYRKIQNAFRTGRKINKKKDKYYNEIFSSLQEDSFLQSKIYW